MFKKQSSVQEKKTAHTLKPDARTVGKSIEEADSLSLLILQGQIGNGAVQRLLMHQGKPVTFTPQTNSAKIQREQVGTRVTHPEGSTSRYRNIKATFDGREFVVTGDRTELLRTAAQSGRPLTVRPADVRTCHGSPGDSYMNNPRYVGIADNGPIPEGEYQFRAAEMSTFSKAEQAKMLLGGHYTDPFERPLHGGDWGVGRVALNKIRVLPSRTGGNTNARSGFYLHGGIMPGSSGCIDVGNETFNKLVEHLIGYRNSIIVTVRYSNPAPEVGAIDRALGRFTYPEGQNPSIMDRIGNLFNW